MCAKKKTKEFRKKIKRKKWSPTRKRVNNRSVNDIGEIFDTFFPSLPLPSHMYRGGEQYQSQREHIYEVGGIQDVNLRLIVNIK